MNATLTLYATEEEAQAAAHEREQSPWNQEIDQERYYAYYSISRGGWIVRPRRRIPGTCT